MHGRLSIESDFESGILIFTYRRSMYEIRVIANYTGKMKDWDIKRMTQHVWDAALKNRALPLELPVVEEYEDPGDPKDPNYPPRLEIVVTMKGRKIDG